MRYCRYENGERLCTPWDTAFDEQFEVIVAGLGTAGAIAAVVAAEAGLRVLGLEPLQAPGGTGTVGRIVGYYYGNSGGRYKDLDREAGGDRGHVPDHPKRRVLLEHMRQGNADVRFGASVTGVFMEGNTLRGVSVLSQGRNYTVGAQVVIDATAEGWLCRAAGVDFTHGRSSDGQFQPYTYNFVTPSDGIPHGNNVDSGHIDPYDAFAYSAEICSTTCDAHHLPQKFAADPFLAGMVPLLGIREGCTFRSREQVTLLGTLLPHEESKPLFFGYSNVDHHGKDTAYEDPAVRDWLVISGLWSVGVFYPVPMGALLPEGVDGLVMAGRHIGVEHGFAPALRMKDEMHKAGESAARIAEYAVRHNCLPAQADVDWIRARLMETGCLKPDESSGLLILDRDHKELGHQPASFPDTPEALAENLASDLAGLGIWAVRRNPGLLQPTARALLHSEDALTRRNAALALSLCGDESCADVLIETAQDRSGYIARTGGRYYQPPQAVAAIAACGRLGLRAAVQPLLAMFRDPGLTSDIPWTNTHLINDAAILYYLWMTNLQISLQQIADRHPDLREDIVAAIRERLYAPGFTLPLIVKEGRSAMDDAPNARRQFENWLSRHAG